MVRLQHVDGWTLVAHPQEEEVAKRENKPWWLALGMPSNGF